MQQVDCTVTKALQFHRRVLTDSPGAPHDVGQTDPRNGPKEGEAMGIWRGERRSCSLTTHRRGNNGLVSRQPLPPGQGCRFANLANSAALAVAAARWPVVIGRLAAAAGPMQTRLSRLWRLRRLRRLLRLEWGEDIPATRAGTIASSRLARAAPSDPVHDRGRDWNPPRTTAGGRSTLTGGTGWAGPRGWGDAEARSIPPRIQTHAQKQGRGERAWKGGGRGAPPRRFRKDPGDPLKGGPLSVPRRRRPSCRPCLLPSPSGRGPAAPRRGRRAMPRSERGERARDPDASWGSDFALESGIPPPLIMKGLLAKPGSPHPRILAQTCRRLAGHRIPQHPDLGNIDQSSIWSGHATRLSATTSSLLSKRNVQIPSPRIGSDRMGLCLKELPRQIGWISVKRVKEVRHTSAEGSSDENSSDCPDGPHAAPATGRRRNSDL
eukprot:gene11388-biopygen5140